VMNQNYDRYRMCDVAHAPRLPTLALSPLLAFVTNGGLKKKHLEDAMTNFTLFFRGGAEPLQVPCIQPLAEDPGGRLRSPGNLIPGLSASPGFLPRLSCACCIGYLTLVPARRGIGLPSTYEPFVQVNRTVRTAPSFTVHNTLYVRMLHDCSTTVSLVIVFPQ
jgi:hypothetical protein